VKGTRRDAPGLRLVPPDVGQDIRNPRYPGLPAEYIVRQMKVFQEPRRKEEDAWVDRQGESDEEVRLAAEYFAAIKPIPW